MINERPSTTAATHAAGEGSPTSPDIGPEYHTPGMFPPHSHADIEQELHEFHPHIHRRRTNNYQEALAERGLATGTADPHTPSNRNYDNTTVDTTHQALMGRQPSFKASDQKRAAMEHLLSEEPKSPGYSTTAPPAAGK